MGADPAPGCPPVLHHFDHLLLAAPAPGGDHISNPGSSDPNPDAAVLRAALRPDTVLQLGGRLTSKRAQAFLEWAALPEASSGW